eukprot:g13532.t1
MAKSSWTVVVMVLRRKLHGRKQQQRLRPSLTRSRRRERRSPVPSDARWATLSASAFARFGSCKRLVRRRAMCAGQPSWSMGLSKLVFEWRCK